MENETAFEVQVRTINGWMTVEVAYTPEEAREALAHRLAWTEDEVRVVERA